VGSTNNGINRTDVPNDEDGFFWRGGGDNESSGGIEDCDIDHWGSVHNRKSSHQGFYCTFLFICFRLFI